MNKLNLSLIGLLQALGVVVYCALIGGLIRILNKFFIDAPEFFSITFVLSLLVFSAAATGSIVFGYPAYLVLKQRIREAISLLIYTLLYLLGIIVIIIIVLVAIG